MARLSARALQLTVLLAASPALAGMFPGSPFSDKSAGTTAAQFLKTPPSARAEALAGTFAAAADGSEAAFWNPAGLGRLADAGKAELSSTYNALLETAYASSLAYAKPVAGVGVFGGGFLYASQGAIQGYTNIGDPTSSFTPSDLALAGSYARPLGRAAFGAGLKIIRSDVAGATGTTLAVDVGVQSVDAVDTQEGPLDLGASLRNLGPPLRLGGSADPLPLKLQAGVLWHLSERIGALLDGHLPVDEDPYVSLAVEAKLKPADGVRVDLRAGYNMGQARGLDGLAGLAAGFGINVGRFRLDYAWVPYGDLGATNRVSIGLTF